ncbi:MAG: peptidoglycan DD-metalloendopeptidase family protein [Firmicutes bacterium]|nr:peptidoglycan DD-metalloendopeptidase family protein [Bacillota bacterium]
MFFNRRKQDNTNKKQKYISLMVVPSHNPQKTRTLRVPRALFHAVIICMLIVSAIVLGFYFRSSHFQRTAQDLQMSLGETEARYNQFRVYAERVQDSLVEVALQIYDELNETESRAQSALNEQAQRHQTELESILNHIEEIERQIREFDEARQVIIDGLSTRADVIPPVAALMAELIESQAILRELSLIHNPPENERVSSVGFIAMGGGAVEYVPTTHCKVMENLQLLLDELYVQRMLMDCLKSYRARMDVYLRNFPTLWPVKGTISSGFGWRADPFGGGGRERHTGVDIPAPTGTNIRAAGGGKVTFSGWSNGYGQTIIIYHGNGISTLYAHNSRNLVSVGQYVERGDVIAHVGSTGRTTGSHLHYEVKINGIHVDPVSFMLEH